MNTAELNAQVAAYRQRLVYAQIRMVVAYDTCHPVIRMFGDTCCSHNPYCGVCGQHISQHTGETLLLCPPDRE